MSTGELLNASRGGKRHWRKYGVRWIFVTPDLRIASELAHTPGWKAAVTSKGAVLYVRDEK